MPLDLEDRHLSSFRRIGSSLTGQILLWSHMDLSFYCCCFLEIFYHSFNFSACNLVVHNFYFFLVQSQKIELFQESVLFFQIIYFIVILLFIIVFYNLLCFCIAYCNLFFFISNFVGLILFSLFLLFFSWWVWLKVCLFCLSSKRTSF